MPEFASLNGELKRLESMFLHANDLSIHRAYAVFDFFKLKDGNCQWLEFYFDRFYNSADLAKIELNFSRDDLRAMIYELVSANSNPDGAIKMILTAGYSEDGYSMGSESNLLIFNPEFQYADPVIYERGTNLISDNFKRPMPEIKSTFYMRSAMLRDRMTEYKAADVLFCDEYVYETSRCNVFIVKGGSILTPEKQILKGITRQRILNLEQSKYPIEIRELKKSELDNADEVFISSSSKGIFPIVRIDDRQVGQGKPGPVTQYLISRIPVL